MRKALVVVHRWCGLFTAVFLLIAGLTGAIISWDHELDEWLNPQLYQSSGAGSVKPPLVLAAAVEQADPRVQVTYLPLHAQAGRAVQMSVASRVDVATGKLYPLSYNQVSVDPVSGAIQGRREWGAISLSRENLLPFLYKLHYSMHLPKVGGIEAGVLFMGIIGIVWAMDCLVALYLSFPAWSAWRKSFAFRVRQGGYKLNFDLHRSGGVWLWLLLLTLAITSVSMNLEREVMRPVVSRFSTLAPSPFDIRQPVPAEKAPFAKVDAKTIIQTAKQHALRKGWKDPAGALFYSPEFQAYGVGFFAAGHDHGDGGLGNPWLYFDTQDGRLLFESVPGTGSAGDVFMQAQFPLHSGRILGVTGRVIVSAMGLVVAMLSVTGIVIWLRKRVARRRSEMTQRITPSITSVEYSA